MQKNETAAGAPPRLRCGSLQRSPDPLTGFKGPLRVREGERRGGKRGDVNEKGGEGQH